MTDYFIDDNASGANDGTSWTDAYDGGANADWTSAATSASTLGDRIIVASDNSTLLGGNLTVTANANHTFADPLQIIVSASGSGTTVAPVSNYGASANGEIDGNGSDINFSGHVYLQGLRVVNMDSSFAGTSQQCQNCFYELSKSGTDDIGFGDGAEIVFMDSDIDCNTGNNRFAFGGDAGGFKMLGGSVVTDSNTNELFEVFSPRSATIYLEGVDLSGINSGTDLVKIGNIESINARFVNCKLPSALSLLGGSITDMSRGSLIIVTGDQGEVYAQYNQGNLLPETTILRDDGADTGSSPFSSKIESSSLASRTNPLKHVFAVSNPGDLDTLTIKCHFAQNSGGALDNSQIWIEAHVQDSSGMNNGTDRQLLGTTPTTHTDESGNVDWRDGAGELTGYDEQSCSVTVTGVTTGKLYIVLCVADDFTTTNNLYVDPEIVVA